MSQIEIELAKQYAERYRDGSMHLAAFAAIALSVVIGAALAWALWP